MNFCNFDAVGTGLWRELSWLSFLYFLSILSDFYYTLTYLNYYSRLPILFSKLLGIMDLVFTKFLTEISWFTYFWDYVESNIELLNSALHILAYYTWIVSVFLTFIQEFATNSVNLPSLKIPSSYLWWPHWLVFPPWKIWYFSYLLCFAVLILCQ